LNVLGILALFALVSKQLSFFKMSHLFVYMKLESLPPLVFHCTEPDFNPLQFLTPYFLAILFDIIFYYQRAVSMWAFGHNFV
jgi:hypothetical protein